MTSTLGNKIKSLRNKKKLSQKEFGKVFSLAESTIGMYERDERKPDYDTLKNFADYFEVTTDYLLGRSTTPKMSEQEEFEAFANDPDLKRWYKELPNSKEEDLQALKQMWDIIKKNR